MTESDEVAANPKNSSAVPRSTRFLKLFLLPVSVGAVTAALAIAIQTSTTESAPDPAADTKAGGALQDFALPRLRSPGEGPPCYGAQEIGVGDLLKVGDRPIFVPEGETAAGAKAIWACGGLTEESPVALLFAGNVIVTSTPVAADDQHSDSRQTSAYTAYVKSLMADSAAIPAREGEVPYVLEVDGVPAKAIPRFTNSLMSLVMFEKAGTEVRVTNDGSITLDELVDVAAGVVEYRRG